MTNPESRSVAPEKLALSDHAEAIQSDDWQITEADIRELTVYGFDSDDQTLVGIGSSRSPCSSDVDHFDSSDQTLVGIGPTERAERASRARAAAEAPESARMPHSELPGPFVASDHDDHDEVPASLPMQKGGPWALALPALLLAAAAVVVMRGIVPHAPAPITPSAASESQAVIDEPQLSPRAVDAAPEPFETSEATAAPAVPSPALELGVALMPEETETTLVAKAPLPAKLPEPVQPPLAKRSNGASEALGSLDITSSPPSNVVLDGRPLGKAPRVVPITPGLHTVVFIHPERGRMLLNVNVNAGQTTSAAVDF